MRLLVVSDMHGNLQAVEKLKHKFTEAGIDLVVACGDFTDDGDIGIAAEMLELLEKIARVVAVPGNMDSKEIIGVLEKRGVNLHKKKLKINGFTFVGLGGAKPVSTYYRFNLGELEAKKYLERLLEGAKGNVVLVMHAPPYGLKMNRTASGVQLGTQALRDAIEKYSPLLCVCGHVHESFGEERVGATLCINIGPLKDGFAVVVELDSDKALKFERVNIFG